MGTRRKLERRLYYGTDLVLSHCPPYSHALELYNTIRGYALPVTFHRLRRNARGMYEDTGVALSSMRIGHRLYIVYILTSDGRIFRRHYAQVKIHYE